MDTTSSSAPSQLRIDRIAVLCRYRQRQPRRLRNRHQVVACAKDAAHGRTSHSGRQTPKTQRGQDCGDAPPDHCKRAARKQTGANVDATRLGARTPRANRPHPSTDPPNQQEILHSHGRTAHGGRVVSPKRSCRARTSDWRRSNVLYPTGSVRRSSRQARTTSNSASLAGSNTRTGSRPYGPALAKIVSSQASRYSFVNLSPMTSRNCT